MTLHEEITKKRQEYFKTATTKQKFAYFVQYYGLSTLLICIAAFFIVSWIYHLIVAPERILCGTFVNYNLCDTTLNINELESDFLTTHNIDESEYIAEFLTNITIIQSEETNAQQSDHALYTQVSSGVLDFAIAEADILKNYAYGYQFVDLTTILSAEQIEIFEPYFLYVDLDVMIEQQEKLEELPLPDMKNPKVMKNPIPVLIDMSDYAIIQEIYGKNSSNICYGIIRKCENPQNAISFLQYLSIG